MTSTGIASVTGSEITKADVERAIAGLAGATFGGRTVNAEVARERPRDPAEKDAPADDAAAPGETRE